MSYAPFTAVQKRVDEFLVLLSELGIDLKSGLTTEDDALAISQVVDYWRSGNGHTVPDPRQLLRDAMGFGDMACRVLNVWGHKDFDQLRPHLHQLGATSILQNRQSSVMDQAANKVIELYFACLAMKFAENVAVDDPDHSKGDNPDVMFDFRQKRWALALKTMHSQNPRTIFDTIKKGADQIEASDADHGLVVINLKNIIDYNALWTLGSAPKLEAVAKAEICQQMKSIAQSLDEVPPAEWVEALGPGRKAKPPVLYVAHGAFYAQPEHGSGAFPMQLKVLMMDKEPQGDPVGAIKLAEALSHHMQGLL